jgi:hypothetical protein
MNGLLLAIKRENFFSSVTHVPVSASEVLTKRSPGAGGMVAAGSAATTTARDRKERMWEGCISQACKGVGKIEGGDMEISTWTYVWTLDRIALDPDRMSTNTKSRPPPFFRSGLWISTQRMTYSIWNRLAANGWATGASKTRVLGLHVSTLYHFVSVP